MVYHKYIFLLGIGSVLFFGRLTAQIKISDQAERIDHAEVDGALMQFQSKDSNKGIRLPYVVLDDMERYKLGGVDRAVYDSAAGTMVYHLGNDTITVSANTLLKQAGVFVWSATKWEQAGGGSIPGKPFPANAVNGDANNYANQYDLKIADADNALYIAVDNDNLENGAYIQAGHSDPGSAFSTAKIAINPFGGSVGIGTTQPIYPLDVDGRIRAGNNTKYIELYNGMLTHGRILFRGAADQSFYMENNSIGSNADLGFRVNSGTKMTIKGSGNIGIGDPSPDEKLEVIGALRVTPTLDINNNNKYVRLYHSNTYGMIQSKTGPFYIENNSNSDMYFRTNGGNTRMTIKNNGLIQLGIYTGTGQRNLAINADGTVTTNVLSSWVEFGTTSPPLLANQAYQVEIAALSSVAVNPAPSFALIFKVSTAGNISYAGQTRFADGGGCGGGSTGYNGIQSGNGTSTIVVRTKACGNFGTLTLSYNAITNVITTSHTGYPNRTRKGRIKTDGFYYR